MIVGSCHGCISCDFETVIVNEGGQYDLYDGVFVAPQKGVYLFSWTVTGNGANYIVSELVVEENVISSAGEYNGKGGHASGSMTALCKMEQGDHACQYLESRFFPLSQHRTLHDHVCL
jgi:hypothetical protein